MEALAITEKSTIEYHEEKFTEMYVESLDLIYEHWKEVSFYPDINIEPDIKSYMEIEQAGALKIYSMREAGQMVGYAVFFIKNDVHCASSLQAHQDMLFIRKDKRGNGRKFINWCDQQLREMGVQLVYHHVKAKHDWGLVLEKMGYELIDKVYGRRLDKWEQQ